MFKKIILTILLIKSSSFSLNRRSVLGGIIGMNVIKSEDINNDLPKISNNNFLLDNDDTKTEYGILQDINNDIYFYSPITQRSCFELKNKINELDMKSTIMHVQYKIVIYLNNTNINPFQLNNLLKKDLWLNAEICLLYGLVDEII
jgi:hypothetical protein